MSIKFSHEGYSFRTVIKYWIIIAVFILVASFVIFQARFLIIGPQIVFIDAPTGPQNERQIHLAGKAQNISRLWLNDRPIYTDAQGNFKEAVVMENGYTVATLRAEDRYGRTTKITSPLVYIPASFIK